MKCSKCQFDNPDATNFCGKCGMPLTPDARMADSLTKTLITPLPVISKDSLVAGKYRIIEEIGAGGMGVVYKAEDLRLQRCVALKFLPPHLMDSPELRERFLIEARAAAALSHPNICVIYEVGESEERPYIAMEFVEGETLRDRIKKGPLEPGDAVGLVDQVAAGLGEAHGKGIIHRDIKSANIMVTGKGQAKVMDFGLAKLRGGSSLTKSQTTLGTVAYMSPEQARGDELDQRTDLWSLGVVLYEMLTGELPFRGDRDLSVIHSIIHEEPRPIRQHKPPVPEELRQVLARALRKNLDSRYGAAGEMLKDLRAYEAALQAEAAGVLNLRSFAKRLRRPVVAVPAALAVVAIAAAVFFFFKHQSRVRWARLVAMPEIARMIEGNDIMRNLVPPYRLAVQAEKVLGDDPKLAELFSKCSLNINVKTDPPGASVYMKEYMTPEAEWSSLGTTPIEKVRVPVGIFRWKFEKEGYETVLAASSTWNVDSHDPNLVVPYDVVRTLDKEGSMPSGMVRVQGAQTGRGKLEDFFIDRYEVTNRQFKDFIDAGGYRKREFWKHPFVRDGRELTWEEAMGEFVDQTALPGPATWSAGGLPDGEGDYPVSGVSWYEAAAFAEYARKSLPTSVHWGTARGQETPWIRFFQLGGYALLAPFSNFGVKGPVPVGSLPGLTTYGAFDMAGNVREWCSNETPAGRIIRGGAWGDNTYEFGNRRHAPTMDRSAKNGFRCVLYPDPEKIPATALQFENLVESGDPRQVAPVPDAVFQIYREQFSYDKTELDARVESKEESPEGWIHERVSFNAAYGGERVLAHLFLPGLTTPPYQTVIYFPGSASTRESSSQNIESYYEFPLFLSFLAKNGRAVLYPVYKGTFERGNPSLATLHAGAASHAYTEFLIQFVKDFKRCIDYLETRPDIDSGKIAFYGMSWGGLLGALIPAVEDRLVASIVCAGGFDRGRPVRPEADPVNYVTRIRMPTLMLNGRYDSTFGLEAGIRPMFDLLGTPAEHKRLILYDTDHIPPRNEFIKETLAWLDKYLGPVERK
jgi:formylglycine-generating enzyme required for sulfatase activity/dienelactone hydrolase